MTVSRKEIERYLGCRGGADERTRAMIEQCLTELERVVTPHTVTQEVSLSIDGDRLQIGSLAVTSRGLAHHLRECTGAVLMAVTLGSGADRLLHQKECTDMSAAVVMQACAAAMVEAVCEDIQRSIEQSAAARGLYIRPRFSPGYGDWPLTDQQPLLDSLEAGKRIGLTVTDSLMLAPTKSVTAVIGLSHQKGLCHVHKCATCAKTDCAFRQIEA